MNFHNNIFLTIDHHLSHDQQPSEYFESMRNDSIFTKSPFTMLKKLQETKQSPLHHPEGNVWNHTMLVVDYAANLKQKSDDAQVFMWAALLHDIGKPSTTKVRKGKITSYDHDKIGAELSKKFLAQICNDNDFIEKTATLIRWHMQILFVVNSLPFADIKAMKDEVNINDVALLGLCDRMGRTGADIYAEKNNIAKFIKKCNEFK